MPVNKKALQAAAKKLKFKTFRPRESTDLSVSALKEGKEIGEAVGFRPGNDVQDHYISQAQEEGFVPTLYDKTAYLSLFKVDPSEKGLGVGTKLLKKFEEKSVKAGAEGVALYASPFARDRSVEQLRQFYEKRGYTATKSTGTGNLMFKEFIPGQSTNLNMSREERLKRGAEQGFNVESPLTFSGYKAGHQALTAGPTISKEDYADNLLLKLGAKENDLIEIERLKKDLVHRQDQLSVALKELEKNPSSTEWIGEPERLKEIIKKTKNKLSSFASEKQLLKDVVNLKQEIEEANISSSEGLVFLKYKKPFRFDPKDKALDEKEINKLAAKAKKAGHDVLIVNKAGERGGDLYLILDQEKVGQRSEFAGFDPKLKKSKHFTAGVAGAAALGGAVASEGQAQASEEHPLAQDAASMSREAKIKFLKMFEGGKNAD